MHTAIHDYTFLQWLVLFYLYCFFGWCFESTYVSLKEKRFVNRGFVRLPLLPIYGSGALCILLVCLPYSDSPMLIYVLGVIFPTILEYVTGWAMERMFRMRYWDYSYARFNIRGYICLKSSVAWGFLSLLMIKVIHPPIDRLFGRLPSAAVIAIAVIVSAAFIPDLIAAFRTAFELRRILEDMERLRGQLEQVRLQAALLRMEAAEQRTLHEQRAAELRREILTRAAALNRKYSLRAMLKAHPTAVSSHFEQSLRLSREHVLGLKARVDAILDEVREEVLERAEQFRTNL